MNHILKLALRNLQRNRRRSITTLLAIVMGVVSILLFGGFSRNITLGQQTHFVQLSGHLQIQRHGYFLYGSSDPVAYGIRDYQKLIDRLRADPQLASLVTVITPTLQFSGIAGNFDAGVSRTVLGVGTVPGDQQRMLLWNEAGFPASALHGYALRGTADDASVIGRGVARTLHLCAPLDVPDCEDAPALPADTGSNTGHAAASGPSAADAPPDVLALAQSESADRAPPPNRSAPHVEVLAASAGGAPNVGRFSVAQAEQQAVKELDDVYLAVHLSQAQRLVYGNAPRVTAIEVQLKHTADLEAARARITQLVSSGWDGQALDIVDFATLNPFYGQSIRMFAVILGFVSLVNAVIVLFTVSNTMSTAIIERTVEIGTLRAMGMRRGGIQALFICEGALLGVAGALLGVLAALAVAALINRAGLTWQPPSYAEQVPLMVFVWGQWRMIGLAFVGFACVAGLSAWLPARHAARLSIVDALRHV